MSIVGEEESEEEEAVPSLQSKSNASKTPIVGSAVATKIDNLSGTGRPLPKPVRSYFEPRFGADFSQVRIHTDTGADQTAKLINARAFTVGRNIAFGASQYAPSSHAVRKLLAHELTHVVQQTQGSCDRRSRGAPSQPKEVVSRAVIQRDAAEAERRAALYTCYPVCSPHDRRRLEHQIDRAKGLVADAILSLNDELARPPGRPATITYTRSALNTHFHTERPADIRNIIAGLGRIHDRLRRRPRNWRCVTRAGCRRICRRPSLACAVTSRVYVCPQHFTQGDTQGALTLVHEAAHQAGMPGDTYVWHRRYTRLTSAQARRNADSYAMFVRDNRYGGALPETTAWTSRDMSIYLDLENPTVVAAPGFSDGRQNSISSGTAVQNRLQGRLAFFVDSAGQRRPWSFTPPEVSVRIVLIREGSRRARSGRPTQTVLWDESDSAAGYQGEGSLLSTSFGEYFEFNFDPQDRGRVVMVTRLRDFDTATTITYWDRGLRVRPTARPAP